MSSARAKSDATTRSTPAPTSHQRTSIHSGRPTNGSTIAATRTARPAYPAQSSTRFIPSSLPPARFERSQREEQREDGEVQVVHDVFRVEHALGEAVEVLDQRQVSQHA